VVKLKEIKTTKKLLKLLPCNYFQLNLSIGCDCFLFSKDLNGVRGAFYVFDYVESDIRIKKGFSYNWDYVHNFRTDQTFKLLKTGEEQ
jgi:hypothetical protein